MKTGRFEFPDTTGEEALNHLHFLKLVVNWIFFKLPIDLFHSSWVLVEIANFLDVAPIFVFDSGAPDP